MENKTEENLIEGGVHQFSSSKRYVKPTDPVLLESLEWFRDQKLAFMMHWGPYSQLGIVESWALSDKDADWSRTGIDWEEDGEEFKRQYFDLNKTFNPIRFQPELWAELAADAGFKYLIFTTKHHDGFSMWNTNETNYKITAPDCPFHAHKYADITKHIFNAFRDKGLGIGAYFSKADWHTPYYWAKGMEAGSYMSRGPSYDPEEYPWLWDKFVSFTHNQMMELLTDYGRIDILWLDAGWVGSKRNKQDIRLGELIEKARKKQPWLLSADRLMGGEYENYITPEQAIPEYPMEEPWESCISMGEGFAFQYDDHYKPIRQIVHTLIEIVCKGGNLALNVAPQPDGRLPSPAVERMKELGKWMDVYGEAIYGTRICAPYFTDQIGFTKKGDTVYCFVLYQEEDEHYKSESINVPFTDKTIKNIDLIGFKDSLEFKQTNDGLAIKMPPQQDENTSPLAHVFRLT